VPPLKLAPFNSVGDIVGHEPRHGSVAAENDHLFTGQDLSEKARQVSWVFAS